MAELFLRPQPNKVYTLDPRMPQYLQVLYRLGYIDMAATLKVLYKYSSSHTKVQSQAEPGQEKAKESTVTRWETSYWFEEFLFYFLTKSVVQERPISDSRTALEVVGIISKWMALFASAATAFAADVMEHLALSQARVDFESSRAALVALLMRLCEHPVLLRALSKPVAKGKSHDALAACADSLRNTKRALGELGKLRSDIAACSRGDGKAGPL